MYWYALRGACAAWVLAAWAAADPIEDIIRQISQNDLKTPLRSLTGVDAIGQPPYYLKNRYSTSSDGRLAADWINEQFKSYGLSSQFHTFDSRYAPNVVAELPGRTRPQDIYVISGHFDTYGGQGGVAPGCDDNGSGTAATMVAARLLSQYQFEGTLRFIAFSAEEQWMVGSLAYAKMAKQRGDRIVANINLDMFMHPSFDNKEPDPDHDLDIGSEPNSASLSKRVADVFRRYTPLEVDVHDDGEDVSDHWAFWQVGYQAVGLSENTADEIWGGSNSNYHRVNDTMNDPHIEWDFAVDAVRGATASIVDLAGLVPEPPGAVLLALVIVFCRRGR